MSVHSFVPIHIVNVDASYWINVNRPDLLVALEEKSQHDQSFKEVYTSLLKQ